MGYTLRQVETERKFCQALTIEALERAVPLQTIKGVLDQQGVQVQRERKLKMVVTGWVVMAMNLYAHLSIGHVIRKLARGLRFVWLDPRYRLPKAHAFTYRRYQLGARPLAALFRQLCRPLATPHTPGAFRFGLRLMAIDGTVEHLPDTPENAAVFGRHHRDRGHGRDDGHHAALAPRLLLRGRPLLHRSPRGRVGGHEDREGPVHVHRRPHPGRRDVPGGRRLADGPDPRRGALRAADLDAGAPVVRRLTPAGSRGLRGWPGA